MNRPRTRWLATAAALLLLTPLFAGPLHPAAAAPPTVYEAETGTLTGVTVDTAASGYTGTGYVTGFDAADDSVTIAIPNSPGGLHELAVVYRAPNGQKTASLLLNGAGNGDVVLAASTTWATAPAGKVLLRPGGNTVTIRSNWGWYDIDAIRLTPVAAPPPHQVTAVPVNPNADPPARALLRYLTAHYGTDVLSGQQDMSGIRWLEQNVGKAPAIAGLDLMDYSPSRVERGTSSTEVENALAWDARGGIVTLCWHWNAPSGLIDTPGKEWWRGFYTDATTFDVAKAMADPASAEYRLLVRDIDAIAVQLKRLRDAGVPVLWRPLHEAEGGWFWWGARGPGPAKALYRLMYDRLTNHHQLTNLIWVWNSVSPDWYPGADVVDVLSVDSYPAAGDHSPVSASYDKLVALGADRKLVALGEVGSIPDPELTRAYRADWSWFVTWSGDFLTDGQSNSSDFLRRIYRDDPHVLTLDELGAWKQTGPSPTPTPTGPTPTPTGPTPSPTPTGPSPTPTPTPSTGGCTATWKLVNQWPGGFQAEVTVRNGGPTTLTGWTVRWTFATGQAVSSAWNTTLTSAGTAVTARNAGWNGTLTAGASTTLGLTGTGPATPAPTPTCTAS
ncbi:glycosyl hydrolase [Micromonospora sp. NPDC092111]|uniref:glycosyl hydrolase n=1 Tax=Micromonospora sp. NPDC092111 TaxID=3364289 RepID=UPI00381B05DD